MSDTKHTPGPWVVERVMSEKTFVYARINAPEYARLSRIGQYYTPARSSESCFENLEQVAIYENLARRNGAQIGYTACLCCSMDIMGMGLCDACQSADCGLSGDEPCNCEELGS